MEISPGIEIIETALLIKKETLVINDLHLGYEASLHLKGILVPRFQLEDIIKIMKRILKVKPKKIIINGDLKHEFGKVLQLEWREISKFLDFLLENCQEVIIIQGNHDPVIVPIAVKKNVKVVKDYRIDDILIIHGDELVETDAKTIIIGHEHPAIKIQDHGKWEKYKCFLKGKWKRKELIAVPSFNPLLEGTNVLEGQMLSPYLKDIKNHQIYVVSEREAFYFGKVNHHF
ncbi:MAG TPA: metallophosphoesterase [Candidatus Nanoarchaeia archaeon]|nr:metallophosphoesterase [Candidatus Nanoarchaeia archaeon]